MHHSSKHLTGHERVMTADQLIVTKTDTSGKVQYGNRTFFEFSDYATSEIIGHQHNVVRHPHMPRTIFDLLWGEISSKREIFAYVNNRAANGDNYWVFAHVTPSLDKENQIMGYHSNRRAPNRDTLNNHIIPMYTKLLEIEQSTDSPKKGLAAGREYVHKTISDLNMSFNEYMFSLGV